MKKSDASVGGELEMAGCDDLDVLLCGGEELAVADELELHSRRARSAS